MSSWPQLILLDSLRIYFVRFSIQFKNENIVQNKLNN